VGEEGIVAGEDDLGALLARIKSAIRKVKAGRVSLDSLGAIFSWLGEPGILRDELFRIATALKKIGITAVMRAKRRHEYGDMARYGVEEFMAGNVVILRNALDDEKRRRTI
jgi:circadian clock protein KaiC